MPLGTISVVLAIIAIKRRGARKNMLALFALVLGTLEITVASAWLLYLALPYI
jgi:hypothetical protein